MQAIVWKEGEWIPSRTGDGFNKHVIFKTIPKNGEAEKEVRLNITDYEQFNFSGQTVKDVWEPYCKEGNVLDVALLNDRNVNKFVAFTVISIKEKNKEQIKHASE